MGRWGPILPFMLSPHEASVSTLFSGVLDIAGVYWPLEEVVVGAAGHGPVLLLVQSVGTIGFCLGPCGVCLGQAWTPHAPPSCSSHFRISKVLFGMPGVPRLHKT